MKAGSTNSSKAAKLVSSGFSNLHEFASAQSTLNFAANHTIPRQGGRQVGNSFDILLKNKALISVGDNQYDITKFGREVLKEFKNLKNTPAYLLPPGVTSP